MTQGLNELKAAVILFPSVYLADVLITGHCFSNISHVRSGEHRLLYAVRATVPFMAARMVY